MSISEKRLSFQVFYFIAINHEIIVKCRWESAGSTVSSAFGSWWSPGGGSEGKGAETFWSFCIRKANN